MKEPRRSNYFKMTRSAKDWDIRDVIEHYDTRPYEEVVKAQQKGKNDK